MAATLHDLKVRRIDGEESSLSVYRGQVLLVVNVASECGLTQQYEGLEALYERYRERGFAVLGFPANEFGGQEPGTNEEICHFGRTRFGVRFPLFEKVVARGPEQHPIFRLLTAARPEAVGLDESSLKQHLTERGQAPAPGEILWNFEKFLVARDGTVVARFAPTVSPEDPRLVAAIEAELAKP